MNKSFSELSDYYLSNLVDEVMPFWERHSLDIKYGGFFTCLDKEGKVYDTDKFGWLQGRQVWTFSMLYNRLEKRPQWLDVARHGIEFMTRHGMDSEGNWYFAMNREGKPLVQPYNIFSDCFAAMAFSQYALATGSQEAKEIAKATYDNIWRRKDNPKGKYSKSFPGTRPLKSFSLPMILCNLSLELEWLINEEELDKQIDACISEVMNDFLDKKRGIIFENVLPDGTHVDSFDGRLLNPGHGIEAMWFVMDLARRRNDRRLINKCVDTTINILKYAWDEDYGGIFYFIDSEGKPPQQLEWDQKVWWVHVETLVALIMGYLLTGRDECWTWFEKVHEYSWTHYPDHEYGEWFGYLNRRGEILLNLKGGKWKGCFHVPRALFMCYRLLSELHEDGPSK